MKLSHATAALLIALCLLLACSSKSNANVSAKDAVEQALHQSGFHDIKVDEDKDKRLITLTGDVHDDALRMQAGTVAQAAAPGWSIANQIALKPAGAEGKAADISKNIDEAIEHTYKAALIGNHLDKAGIHFSAKNGVLTLTGNVDDPDTRTKAEALGKTVPNVREVVNKLDVKHQPATTR